MKKQTVYIFAAFIVVLLILAIVIMWLTGSMGGSDDPEVSPTPAVQTDALQQTEPTPTPLPETPAPSDEPDSSPEPSATPEPAVQPGGTIIGTGAFDSDTGVGLNTHTVWTAAEQADGSVMLSLSVYVRSYSVEIGQRVIAVTVNGSTVTGVTRAFGVDAPNAMAETLVYSYTATVSRGSIPVNIDWNYNGQYSGQELEHISSGGVINIV